jgi:hypothetical protein
MLHKILNISNVVSTNVTDVAMLSQQMNKNNPLKFLSTWHTKNLKKREKT